jgi:CRP-like cAMP-binding protein
LCSSRTYEAGASIFREGDSAEQLFVLEEGKVALQKDVPLPEAQLGRRITVDVVTRGEVFGWSSIVAPHIYTLSAICLQKTSVVAIDGARLRSLLQEDHHMAYEVLHGLLKVVASRLADTMQLLITERSMLTEAGKQLSPPQKAASEREAEQLMSRR